MADVKIGIPKREEVPAKVTVSVVQPAEKPAIQETLVKPSITTKNIDDKTMDSMIETIKNSREATERVVSMIMSSIDLPKFKEKLIEEVLKDAQLRNRIMLELLRKL